MNMALFRASASGDNKLVRNLVGIGANVNWKNVHYYGYSALHIACQKGFYEVVSTLLSQGADVNSRAAAGETPLHEAAYEGHQLVALLLVTEGACLYSKSNYHVAPIDFARKNGFLEALCCAAKHREELERESRDLRRTLSRHLLHSCCRAIQSKRVQGGVLSKAGKTLKAAGEIQQLSAIQMEAEDNLSRLMINNAAKEKAFQRVHFLEGEISDAARLKDTKRRMHAKEVADLTLQVKQLEEELIFVKQQLEKSYSENNRIEAFIDESVKVVSKKNSLLRIASSGKAESPRSAKLKTLQSRVRDAEDRAFNAMVRSERAEKLLYKQEGSSSFESSS